MHHEIRAKVTAILKVAIAGKSMCNSPACAVCKYFFRHEVILKGMERPQCTHRRQNKSNVKVRYFSGPFQQLKTYLALALSQSCILAWSDFEPIKVRS